MTAFVFVVLLVFYNMWPVFSFAVFLPYRRTHFLVLSTALPNPYSNLTAFPL